MNYRSGLPVAWLCLTLGVSGCSSARDVEVSGSVTAPSSLQVGDRLVVDFIDVVGVGSQATQTIAAKAELNALGEFKQTIALEGDQLRIVVIDDRDGNGACSANEAWGETQAEINQNKAEAADLNLGMGPCPDLEE